MAQKDYSLIFKLQVADEVVKGLITYKESQRYYEIQGRSTVLVWLRKHGTFNWKIKTPMKKSSLCSQILSRIGLRFHSVDSISNLNSS